MPIITNADLAKDKMTYTEFIKQFGICVYCQSKYKCLVDEECTGFVPQTQREGLSYTVVPNSLAPSGPIPVDNMPDVTKQIILILKTNERKYRIKGEMHSIEPLTITHIHEIIKS